MVSVTGFNRKNFIRRIRLLYSAWKRSEGDSHFPQVDSICLPMKAESYDYKSLPLQMWLFGCYIDDVIMIFAQDSFHLLADKRTVEFLQSQQVKFEEDDSIRSIHLYVKNKQGPETKNIEDLIAVLKKSGQGKTVGTFLEDEFKGPLMECWNEALKEHDFEKVDISEASASLLSTKDEGELSSMKQACQVTVNVYKNYLKPQIIELVKSKKQVTHAELSQGFRKAITQKRNVSKSLKLRRLAPLPRFSPIIENGSNHSCELSEILFSEYRICDPNILHFGAIIICSFGVEYNLYSSNMVRTLLVNPTDSIQKNYNLLVALQEHLMTVLRPGSKLQEVYESGVNFVRVTRPDLVPNLSKNFGFVTGIEFNEKSLSIAPTTTACARKTQVYILSVGLSNLVNKDIDSEENENYSLFVGDMVVVNELGPATVLVDSRKNIDDIAIFSKEESGYEDGSESDSESEQIQIASAFQSERDMSSKESENEISVQEPQNISQQVPVNAEIQPIQHSEISGGSKRESAEISVQEPQNISQQVPVNAEIQHSKISRGSKRKSAEDLPIVEEEEDDEDYEMFFMSMCKMTKKLSKFNRILVRTEIHETVMKYQIRESLRDVVGEGDVSMIEETTDH